MADGQGADAVKPDPGAGAADVKHINLKVLADGNAETHFKIKRTTKMKKLMDTYCQRNNVNKASLVFQFDGDRIKDEDTPESLEMEEGDSIDAFVHQTGGYS